MRTPLLIMAAIAFWMNAAYWTGYWVRGWTFPSDAEINHRIDTHPAWKPRTAYNIREISVVRDADDNLLGIEFTDDHGSIHEIIPVRNVRDLTPEHQLKFIREKQHKEFLKNPKLATWGKLTGGLEIAPKIPETWLEKDK